MSKIKTYLYDNIVLLPIFIASVLACLMLGLRYIFSEGFDYSFMTWNLFLAWVPAIAVLPINYKNVKISKTKEALLLVTALFFLPNSFYMFTDFIHITRYSSVNIVLDVGLLTFISLQGLVLGIYVMDVLFKRYSKYFLPGVSHLMVVLLSIACGFAIDLGRFGRFNSWDVIAHPFGLLYAIANVFISPFDNQRTYAITAMFSIIILFAFYTKRLISVSSHKK